MRALLIVSHVTSLTIGFLSKEEKLTWLSLVWNESLFFGVEVMLYSFEYKFYIPLYTLSVTTCLVYVFFLFFYKKVKILRC